MRILEEGFAMLITHCLSPICPASDPAGTKQPKNCRNQQHRVEPARHVRDKLVCQLGGQFLPVCNVSLLCKHFLWVLLHDEAGCGVGKRFPDGPSQQEDEKTNNNSEEENQSCLCGGRPQDCKGGRTRSVAHEVEVKRKLVGKLDSHSHPN